MNGRTLTEVDVGGTKATFCYLLEGDMLRSGGGCDSAIAARFCVVWGKFRKLLPALTTRHVPPLQICQPLLILLNHYSF